MRYIVVGGVCFALDAGTLVLGREVLFHSWPKTTNLIMASALGFLVGLIANYVLSQVFVFRSATQRALGWKVSAFLIYALVGAIGFALTLGGMWVGVRLVGDTGFRYVFVKCVVTGIVLIWNYVGRKVWVYKGA